MSYRTAFKAQGFALPTVVVVSVILLTILTAGVGASSSVYSSLNAQYYDQLAREASESGVNVATSCLKKNNYVSQFTANSLYPSNACTGGTQCATVNCYIVFNSAVRTTFKVEPISATAPEQVITSTGTVELLRKSDGTVWKTYKHVTRAAVSRDSSFSSIAFGYHGLDPKGAYFGVTSPDGKVVTVGLNAYGQLGNGTLVNSPVPVQFKVPNGVKVTGMYTNFLSQGRSLYATTSTGAVYGAGRNALGMLGIGSVTATESTPKLVLTPAGQNILSVASLYDSAFFVSSSGNVYASGECAYGMLGTGYTIAGCANLSTPVRVALPAVNILNPGTLASTEIAADRHMAFVRMKGGQVYGWGENSYGELGDGTTTASSTPKKIGTFGDAGQPKAVQIQYDGTTLYIVGDNGVLYGTGNNANYMVGVTPAGGNITAVTVVDTSACQGGMVKKVSTDQWHTAVVTSSGQLCMLGNNNVGQLGTGNTTASAAVRVGLPDAGVYTVDATVCSTGALGDMNNTYVIGTNGKVYATGSNNYGQLGNGTTTNSNTFIPMNIIDGVNIVAESVLCGGGTTVIATTAGRIYTVGNNASGQLGDGTTTNSGTPKANPYTNMFNVYTY